MKKDNYDIVFVGGGIAGLMGTHKFSSLGYKVLLIEKQSQLCTGPSIRNEGWLHRGSYHSGSIRDREAAIQVASRCIYGHDQIRAFAPEAVEDVNRRPFALVRSPELAEEVQSRYEEAGVTYRLRSTEVVGNMFPGANLEGVAAAFEVDDVSINTRILYKKMLNQARVNGAVIMLDSEVESVSGNECIVVNADNERVAINSTHFIYSTGYGTRELVQKLFATTLTVRYWKSHLVISKRLGPTGLFFIDPHEAAMMHHGEVSIIGLNEDALLSKQADYDVIPEKAENLHRALTRLVPNWESVGYRDLACVKVDFAATEQADRSLNIAIREVADGHIVVLPGKMTETPFLIDTLVEKVENTQGATTIAARPCDDFISQVQNMRAEHVA